MPQLMSASGSDVATLPLPTADPRVGSAPDVDQDPGVTILDATPGPVVVTDSATGAVLTSHLAAQDLDLPRDPVVVWGDREELGRAVLHLLGNAVKVTEGAGSVACTLAVDARRAILRVVDTGLGIPVQAQGYVYERFFRGALPQEREIQGSGLGLAIVDTVVQSHAGEISVVSEVGTGSEFVVRLPLSDGVALLSAVTS